MSASDKSDRATHEQSPQAVSAAEAVAIPSAAWDESLRGPRMSDATGKVIFKYQMPVLESFTMELPTGADIIRVQDQGGMFWLWAVVDTDAPLESRQFMAFKTGAAMPRDTNLAYVGFCAVFVQMELGLYIFEVLP
ncbi:hypothetical protein HNO88_000272 [Novosphingobium chloroacetimidivorans]|uniref:DUF7352 domain-containing protein n=1 Tax=Novosphingobium chloroacetimidivorans TaxID=1428314 RepID=A0A7W7K661_9SPHN|nr:hypothetical protein [Novosphingobium chloroacetimidivorans]MBB4856975.1 hypothetical protein [Novosphingobium chloroacetimidivorans]